MFEKKNSFMSEFFHSKLNHFLEGLLCPGKQAGSNETCSLLQMWQQNI